MVAVVVSISIMVAVVMAPCPIVFLLFRAQLPEIAVGVPVRFIRPATIVNLLVRVPAVIIGVVGVVYPIIVMPATTSNCAQ